MQKLDFYQSHLNRVSRSFAYCIGNLNGPLKAWVGLTYLICRVLDTVEDAPWSRSEDQLRHFDRFNDFLNLPPELKTIQEWSGQFPKEIPEGEKQLLGDSHQLFLDLHQSPESVKVIISEMVLSMSQGMRHFAQKKQGNEGRLKLHSLKEVNHYCFFVAGVVGEALAKLVGQIEPQFQLAKNKIHDAHHFGLFLQKVNLLKDQAVDATEGREFVFDRDQIYASLSYNAHGAYRFLAALPIKQKEFRLFCAWSLFLGLASLPFLESLHQLGESGKLPRDEAESIFSSIEAMIDDPSQVEDTFRQFLKAAGLRGLSDSEYFDESLAQKEAGSLWPSGLYHGTIGVPQAASLGF